MSRRITKVKVKLPLVEIHSEEVSQTNVKESVFKSTEKPHPDLEMKLAALIPFVCEILELPQATWNGRITITGVSFSKSEDAGIEGAVITGRVDLETSLAPFCFNTPHLPFSEYSEGSDSPTMDADAVMALERVRAEAVEFLEGKRAQQELAF